MFDQSRASVNIHDLLQEIAQSGISCNIGGADADADDIVLLAPSWRTMQDLVLEKHTAKIDVKCNENETVFMVLSLNIPHRLYPGSSHS